METSLLLYLRPDLVRPLEEAGDGNDKKPKIKAFSEGWLWAERKWSQISEDTGVGNPKMGTTEKGKAFFKDITEKMAQAMVDIAAADIEDLYE